MGAILPEREANPGLEPLTGSVFTSSMLTYTK
jgi:hypothetical protein